MVVVPVIRLCSSTLYTIGTPFLMMATSHSMRSSWSLAGTWPMDEEEEGGAMVNAVERMTEVKCDYENGELG